MALTLKPSIKRKNRHERERKARERRLYKILLELKLSSELLHDDGERSIYTCT